MKKQSVPQEVLSIIDYFQDLEDPRRDSALRCHLLSDIIAMTLCAVICGMQDFVHVALFAEGNQEWFGSWLSLPAGIPSHDTFGRVFSLLDADKFQECLRQWAQNLRQRLLAAQEANEKAKPIISIDGKTLCGSASPSKGIKGLHMVHAWAADCGLVLCQKAVEEKSNEITAIPQLLRILDLENCIITIDAMGCQREIATEIINSDADYVLALKGNQETMHKDSEAFFADCRQNGFGKYQHDYLEYTEKDHGRLETRRVWSADAKEWLDPEARFEGLHSVSLIEREVQDLCSGKKTLEERYFISSLAPNAKELARAIRSHWSIENQCHWTLDVTFREDEIQVRHRNAVHNFATIRRMALNLLKSAPHPPMAKKTKKPVSLKSKQHFANWDRNYLLSVLKS